MLRAANTGFVLHKLLAASLQALPVVVSPNVKQQSPTCCDALAGQPVSKRCRASLALRVFFPYVRDSQVHVLSKREARNSAWTE